LNVGPAWHDVDRAPRIVLFSAAAVEDLQQLDSLAPRDHNDRMTPEKRHPLAVGCRELKTRLGTYMRHVKEGATILVTERGRPIAELRPVPSRNDVEEALYRLAAQGLVSREVREPLPLEDFRPIKSTKSLSQAIIEDRKDRF
jgi:prevent-host-death family protein